ncbi:MAG TPA: MlaD family protein [Solirubrobacteraceae bacterium]|nr:MlaD family protein [Solirubrobacteraceae bacterium]
MNRFTVGLIGIVVLVLLIYGGFTKFANPFASPFTVYADFPNANQIKPGSFVRIAGINVGTVTSIEPASGRPRLARVGLQISGEGLPIHEDATMKIRPRTFLEGNFFVDLQPGTPNAPVAPSGYTFPAAHAATPVQLDQVLTSLQAGTRRNLQVLLSVYGGAVRHAGPAYNASIPYWTPAYKYTGEVTHDLLGTQPGDLGNLVANGATVAQALDSHPQNLENLITDFNTTANAFARVNTSLAATVAELPRTLAAAQPALTDLNKSFPPLERLARALIPGVKATGPTIDVSLPFISQLRQLVQPSELRGLTSDLAVTVPALAHLTNETIPLMPKVRAASSCISNVIFPWSQQTVPDTNFTPANGFPNRQIYQEALDFLPGLAGESRNFDSNGTYIRILGGSGSLTYSLQPGLLGQALSAINGVQPQPPPNGTRPPLHPNTPCETQTVPDLYSPAGLPPNQITTGLSGPGAAARYQASAKDLLGVVSGMLGSQGLPSLVSKVVPSIAQLTGAGGSTGGSAGSSAGSSTGGSAGSGSKP